MALSVLAEVRRLFPEISERCIQLGTNAVMRTYVHEYVGRNPIKQIGYLDDFARFKRALIEMTKEDILMMPNVGKKTAEYLFKAKQKFMEEVLT